MKSNQEILDEFGKILIDRVFDNQYSFILNKIEDLALTEEYKNLFEGMSDVKKKEIETYTYELLKGALFDFLKVFEENKQFKLIHEDNEGKLVDLTDISEMLKAEPIIENGWIARYSSYLKNKQ
jgi:hypothetical protein